MRALILYLALLLSSQLCGPAAAQAGDLGAGIIVGEPTGLSGKLWLDRKTALDGAASWSFREGRDLHLYLHVDYVLHQASARKARLFLYYGIGVKVQNGHPDTAGARMPIGLTYLFAKAPLDLFVEVVPELDLAPGTGVDLAAAAGFRYYF